MWLPFRNPGCHTQAQSLDEVAKRIREAIELCLEVEGTPKQDLEFRRNPAHYDRGMSRAPRVTGTDIIVALSKIGFQVVRVRGSHHFLSPRGWAKRPLCLCGAWPIIGRRANSGFCQLASPAFTIGAAPLAKRSDRTDDAVASFQPTVRVF